MSIGTCHQCGSPGRITVCLRGTDPRNLGRICEAMSTISELSSRIHSDHWLLPTDILQANAPHQLGPWTMSADLRAHPLHQMPRTIPLTATYYVCEGTRHQRRSPNYYRSGVAPLLGENTAQFPASFQVTPDRSELTFPPAPQQAPVPGTECTAYALQRVPSPQVPIQRHAQMRSIPIPHRRGTHRTVRTM